MVRSQAAGRGESELSADSPVGMSEECCQLTEEMTTGDGHKYPNRTCHLASTWHDDRYCFVVIHTFNH